MINLVNLDMKLPFEFEGFREGTPLGVVWDNLLESGMSENEAIEHISSNMPINPKLGVDLRSTFI